MLAETSNKTFLTKFFLKKKIGAQEFGRDYFGRALQPRWNFDPVDFIAGCKKYVLWGPGFYLNL